MGAFGAHALEPQLIESGRLDTYETAVQYHFYHVIASLIILIVPVANDTWRKRASMAFLAGIMIFSGSLYFLSLSGITWLGAITPIGGVLFIVGWLMLIPAFRKA